MDIIEIDQPVGIKATISGIFENTGFLCKINRDFMKTILFAAFLFLSFIPVHAQSVASSKAKTPMVTAKVDRRIELTTIIARLAGYDEYLRNDFVSYTSDVDRHFAEYKNHPAIGFARKVRENNGIAFDAVPSLAVHLNPDLTPKFPFSDSAPDERWGRKNAEEFAKLLQQFCRDADCETFFDSHAELYKTAETRMQEVINRVDFAWYKNFYGEVPKGSFNLYIGLLNGGMNFGPKVVYPDGREELFAVIGAWKTDEKGLPIFADDFLPTIIHEFNHSFINHLVYARTKQFQPSGEKIFQPVAAQMTRLAYGNWRTTIVESLVRAAVIRYLFDHGEVEKASAELINERNRGFLWIDELFVLLGTFENNRKAYPTFRSFLPLIEGYAVDLSKRIEEKAKHFEKRQPRVVAIDAFANGAQDVDPKLTQITFTFDQPLEGTGYSINRSAGGREHFPIEKVIGYSQDRTKFTVEVKLKPDWEYEFDVTGLAFKSIDGYPLQNYAVKFKTKKE